MELIHDWRRATQLLIETNDLDPMYSVIHQIREDYDDEWYYQWLMHYTLFYDPRGAMEAIDVDHDDFWPWINTQAAKTETKRGSERRHFRGEIARAAIHNLREKGDPATIFKEMYSSTYSGLVRNIETKFPACGIGPYFTWKIMDFFNVCDCLPVRLTYDEVKRWMPDQPLATIHDTLGGWKGAIEVNEFVEQFDHPVRPGKCSWAETETVLCNFKGLFYTGTVWIGRDIAEYKEVLRGTGYDQYLPEAVPKGRYICQRTENTFAV